MNFFRVQSLLWNFKYLLTLLSKPEYWVITDSNNNIITVHLVKNIFCKKKYYNYILVKHFGFEMHFIWQSVSKSVTLRGECNFLVYYIRYTAEIFSEDSYSLCVSSALFCPYVCLLKDIKLIFLSTDREGGGIGLFISLGFKVLKYVFLFVGITFLGTFNELWLIVY